MRARTPRRCARGRKKVDGGFLLNGAKTWISNAPIADLLLVWAKDDAGEIRGFLVERKTARLEDAENRGKDLPPRLGHRQDHDRTSSSCRRTMLPDVYGLRGPSPAWTSARYGIAWARSARPNFAGGGAGLTLERKQFGRPFAATSWCKRNSPTCRRRSPWACRRCRARPAEDQDHATPEMISLCNGIPAARLLTSPGSPATCTVATASSTNIT